MAQKIQSPTATGKTFNRLMRLGYVARAEGHHRKAHSVWRQAAMLRPDDEQVWQALLEVIDNDEDLRVCLRNILAVNPNNTTARRMLQERFGISQPFAAPSPRRPAAYRLGYEILLRLVQSLLMGFLIAVGLIGIQFISF
jgi:hypothetical protein